MKEVYIIQWNIKKSNEETRKEGKIAIIINLLLHFHLPKTSSGEVGSSIQIGLNLAKRVM